MTIDTLMSVIAYFRITKAPADERFNEVAYSAQTWRRTGKSIGMSGGEREHFVDALEHGERTAQKGLSED